MGNLGNSIKKFISNKNTVTILAVFAGIIVLWYFYNDRVNKAITTIRVPYAIEEISAGGKIESENIDYKEITQSATNKSDIITNVNDLTDMYVCIGKNVPANGFFYKSQICPNKILPDAILDKLKDDETLYSLDVNMKSTYANSILPDTYIDIYLSSTEDGELLFGPLIKSIQVLAVRDSSGRDVFWDNSAGDSAMMLFAVPNDLYVLFQSADRIQSENITLIPVPRGRSYTAQAGQTEIGSKELEAFILEKRRKLEGE